MLNRRSDRSPWGNSKWAQAISLMGLTVSGLGMSAFAALTYPNCTDLKPEEFRKTVVTKGFDEPMELDVAPDGRVFIGEQHGGIKIVKPDGSMVDAGSVPAGDSETGLVGLTLDVDFPTKPYLYVNYGKSGDNQHGVVRLTIAGDKIVAGSEKLLLKTGVFQGLHRGGSISMGKDGNLFIGEGENSTWHGDFPGLGAGGEADDARRTAGSTNDLRGKILRIHPKEDGTYDIPAGNLFPEGTADTRPEIYGMGFRQPYRIWADPVTGWVMEGEVGIDATAAKAGVGPVGYDEFNLVTAPGNFGWPFFGGPNAPYYKDGKAYDPANPINDSPYNKGLKNLPPLVQPTFYYEYRAAKYPFIIENVPGNKCAMAGPAYHYNGASPSKVKFPPHLDGKWLVFEWEREWIAAMTVSPDGKQELGMEKLFTGMTFQQPIDLEFGPDGALYVLEYGPKPVWDTKSPESKLSKIEYTGSCAPASVATHSAYQTAKNNSDLKLVVPAGDGSLLLPSNAKSVELRGLKGELLLTFANLDGRSAARINVPAELRGKTLFLRVTRH